jgi:hypothetical protein
MTDAPQRIWANPDHWIEHPPRKDVFRPDEYVEYIRKDVSDVLVAAAREQALREALDAAREYRYRRGEAVENAILALIVKDQ